MEVKIVECFPMKIPTASRRAREEELIRETTAALTSWGDSTCAILPSDIYVAKISFAPCTVIT